MLVHSDFDADPISSPDPADPGSFGYVATPSERLLDQLYWQRRGLRCLIAFGSLVVLGLNVSSRTYFESLVLALMVMSLLTLTFS